MSSKILVTGGTGMCGKSLRKIVKDDSNYIFIGSKDCDLTDEKETDSFLEKVKPSAIINLAAVVGGLYYNIDNNAEMLDKNIRIGLNICKYSVKHNVKKVILVNSTCAFPSNPKQFPMREQDIHDGPPHWSNEGYAYAKRITEVAGRLYNKKSETKFITVYPCNLYGPYDNFNLNSCHVLSALLMKAHIAKKKNKNLEVWGTGNALRQFLYVDDFSRLLIRILNEFKGESLILSGNQEISINDLAKIIINIVNISETITYTEHSDGVHKKTVSNKVLLENFPTFEFTDIEKGVLLTYMYLLEIEKRI